MRSIKSSEATRFKAVTFDGYGIQGARAAGLCVAWLNRTGRPRRTDLPAPDFEIRDLTELPGLL